MNLSGGDHKIIGVHLLLQLVISSRKSQLQDLSFNFFKVGISTRTGDSWCSYPYYLDHKIIRKNGIESDC